MPQVTRRVVLSTLAGIGTASLPGCSALERSRGANERPPAVVGSDWSPPPATWAMSDRGPRRRRSLAAPGPTVDPLIETHVPGTWTESAPSRSVVAATADTVYLDLDGGTRGPPKLQALRTGDWTERWHHEVGPTPGGGLAAGQLYYVEGDGRVVALGTDGEVRWEVDLYERLAGTVGNEYLPEERADFDVEVTPTAETVYGVSNYGLHGLAAGDGTERWRVAFPDGSRIATSSPAVGRHAAWTIGGGGSIYRLDETGLATLALQDVVDDLSVLSGSRILLSNDGQWSVYDQNSFGPVGGTPIDPSPAWQFEGHAVSGGDTEITRPAVAEDRVVVGEVVSPEETATQRVAVYAVDAANGRRRWSHEVAVTVPDSIVNVSDLGAAPILTAPVIAGGTVYVGVTPRWTTTGLPVPEDGTLLALEAGTGAVRWRRDVGIVPDEVAVAGNYCYVTDEEWRLVVVG